MGRFHWMIAVSWVWAGSCSGSDTEDKDTIIPLDDADADTDSDTDSDTDTDTDTDTDVPIGLCDPLPTVPGTTVAATDNLAAAIAAASPGDTLILDAGTYTIAAGIPIDKGLTIRSASGLRDDVIIDAAYAPGPMFDVTASDVTLAHITLTHSGTDFVYVHPDGGDVTGLRIHDVYGVDGGAYGVRADGDGTNWVDDAEVSCSTFELTDAARLNLATICDAGGVEAQGTRGWTVRDSRFVDFWCENGAPPPVIRFWRGARDTLVTRNVVADAGLGIVVGQTAEKVGRTYADDPCGAVVQSIAATVTNNIVFAYDSDLMDSTGGIRAGILAESSCDVSVIHNSVYSRLYNMVEPESSIEYTFPTTTGVVANNLLSHALRRLVDSEALVAGNIENTPEQSWFFPIDGDFHTSPAADDVIDAGDPSYLSQVPVDIDNAPRDAYPDVGADEQ